MGMSHPLLQISAKEIKKLKRRKQNRTKRKQPRSSAGSMSYRTVPRPQGRRSLRERAQPPPAPLQQDTLELVQKTSPGQKMQLDSSSPRHTEASCGGSLVPSLMF